MEQLGMVMLEIDHILSLISEGTVADDVNPDRDSGLHALFQEKVNIAVALRYGINQRLNKASK